MKGKGKNDNISSLNILKKHYGNIADRIETGYWVLLESLPSFGCKWTVSAVRDGHNYNCLGKN